MPWVEMPAACAGSRNIVTCSGQFATAGEVFIVSLHVSSGLTRPDHLRLHLPECLLEWDAIAKNAHSMYSTTSSPASLTNPLSDAFHSHLGDSGAIMPIRVYQRHVTWRARRTSHVLTHLPSPVKSCSAQYYRLHKKLTGPMSTCALTKVRILRLCSALAHFHFFLYALPIPLGGIVQVSALCAACSPVVPYILGPFHLPVHR
jgi:hypothetical protein